MTHEKNVPRALREVWEWKDAIYQEVKHLPRAERLRAILDNAAHAARELGMTAQPPLVIRETSLQYGTCHPAAASAQDKTGSAGKKTKTASSDEE